MHPMTGSFLFYLFKNSWKRNMLIMVAGAARAHKLMVEEHAHAKHGTGQSGHGGDLGFGLIPE